MTRYRLLLLVSAIIQVSLCDLSEWNLLPIQLSVLHTLYCIIFQTWLWIKSTSDPGLYPLTPLCAYKGIIKCTNMMCNVGGVTLWYLWNLGTTGFQPAPSPFWLCTALSVAETLWSPSLGRGSGAPEALGNLFGTRCAPCASHSPRLLRHCILCQTLQQISGMLNPKDHQEHSYCHTSPHWFATWICLLFLTTSPPGLEAPLVYSAKSHEARVPTLHGHGAWTQARSPSVHPPPPWSTQLAGVAQTKAAKVARILCMYGFIVLVKTPNIHLHFVTRYV